MHATYDSSLMLMTHTKHERFFSLLTYVVRTRATRRGCLIFLFFIHFFTNKINFQKFRNKFNFFLLKFKKIPIIILHTLIACKTSRDCRLKYTQLYADEEKAIIRRFKISFNW